MMRFNNNNSERGKVSGQYYWLPDRTPHPSPFQTLYIKNEKK